MRSISAPSMARQQRERQKAKEQTNATRSVPTAARKYEASSTGEKWMRGGTSIPRSTRTQPARSSTSSSDSSSGSSTSSSKDYQAAKSMAATVEQLASAVALLRSEVAQLQKKSDEQARELMQIRTENALLKKNEVELTKDRLDYRVRCKNTFDYLTVQIADTAQCAGKVMSYAKQLDSRVEDYQDGMERMADIIGDDLHALKLSNEAMTASIKCVRNIGLKNTSNIKKVYDEVGEIDSIMADSAADMGRRETALREALSQVAKQSLSRNEEQAAELQALVELMCERTSADSSFDADAVSATPKALHKTPAENGEVEQSPLLSPASSVTVCDIGYLEGSEHAQPSPPNNDCSTSTDDDSFPITPVRRFRTPRSSLTRCTDATTDGTANHPTFSISNNSTSNNITADNITSSGSRSDSVLTALVTSSLLSPGEARRWASQ